MNMEFPLAALTFTFTIRRWYTQRADALDQPDARESGRAQLPTSRHQGLGFLLCWDWLGFGAWDLGFGIYFIVATTG
jgi:hypothetical protein